MPPAPTTPTTFSELVTFALGFIQTFIGLIFVLVFVVIVWKIIDAWIIHGDESASRESGRSVAVTGVIILAIMAAIWGILALLQASFGGI